MTVLLALLSSAVYGAADFLGGLASRRAATLAVVVVSQFVGMLLLVVALPLLPDATPSRADWLWGAAAGLSGGGAVALLYRALAIGTMALVAPTTAVCGVSVPVVAAILLGERPSPLQFSGIALALVAIVLVSQQPATGDEARAGARRRGLPPGIGLALMAGVAVGLFYLSIAQAGDGAGMWPLLSARLVSVTFFSALAILSGRSLRVPRPATRIVVGAGALDMLANALYLLATRGGPLSVVVTLSSLYPASTVFLARVVLGERLNRWQAAGIACALVAVVLIVV